MGIVLHRMVDRKSQLGYLSPSLSLGLPFRKMVSTNVSGWLILIYSFGAAVVEPSVSGIFDLKLDNG